MARQCFDSRSKVERELSGVLNGGPGLYRQLVVVIGASGITYRGAHNYRSLYISRFPVWHNLPTLYHRSQPRLSRHSLATRGIMNSPWISSKVRKPSWSRRELPTIVHRRVVQIQVENRTHFRQRPSPIIWGSRSYRSQFLERHSRNSQFLTPFCSIRTARRRNVSLGIWGLKMGE